MLLLVIIVINFKFDDSHNDSHVCVTTHFVNHLCLISKSLKNVADS